jgi:hypothetical protein
MSYKVIQWATGNVGIHALRGIAQHPDLELVGLWVSSAGKPDAMPASSVASARPVSSQRRTPTR